MQPALPLRPPPFFQLFSDTSFDLKPPPLPDVSAEQPNILGIRTDAGSGFVLPLDKLGIEQLYDERCFDPSFAASGSCTPKSELKRLSTQLRSHVHLVALALADEALGVAHTPHAGAGASASSAALLSSSNTGEPRSLALSRHVHLLQVNMMHLLARLREMEAWSRLESAAATAAWADGTKPEDAASRVVAAAAAPR